VVRNVKGRVDIVFANAGVVDPVSLAESTPETFDKHFSLNARGAYFTVQKALPLLADKASIIISGSAAWQMGVPGFGAYSATKAALVSFVRTWTAELASRGIRANVIIVLDRRRLPWSMSAPKNLTRVPAITSGR